MMTSYLSEACRLYILIVLLASGVGKLRAIASFAETLEILVQFPERWSRPAAVAIASVEILVALGLGVGGRAAQYSMIVALALFLVFTAVLIFALVRRETVSCNCFGTDEHPISGWDIARNGMLMAAGTTQVVMGPPTVVIALVAWPMLLAAGVLAFLISTNLQKIATKLGLAQVSKPLEPPPPLPTGQVIPAFEGQTAGRRFISDELAGEPAVLLFMSSGCPKCRGKIPEILRILPAIREAGIRLWIVPADSKHDISLLLGNTVLLDHVLTLDTAARDQLNPRHATPLYIFIDDKKVALATGQIGDSDWLSFVDQMNELLLGADAAE